MIIFKSATNHPAAWVTPLVSFMAHFFEENSGVTACGMDCKHVFPAWDATEKRPAQFCLKCEAARKKDQ